MKKKYLLIIEYEGTAHSEMEGILLTLELLKKVRDSVSNDD